MTAILFMENRLPTFCAVRGVRLFLILLLLAAGCGHSTHFIEEESGDIAPSAGEEGGGESSPSASASTSVSFVTFGDWGSGRTAQQEVAEAIGDYCIANPCDFVLTLGDNFYSAGVSSTGDPLWIGRFHDVYDFLGLVFYAALGNHDNEGSIEAQIAYTDLVDNWVMLDEHYTFSKPDVATPPLVDFFIINSDWPNFDRPAQDWLDASIETGTARWKILAMHHPIYSNGSHGDGEESYREDLVPIICNRIDLVLSAHDHSFSHLRSDQDGCLIEQLVIGTGGARLRAVAAGDARVLATDSFYGFGWVQVTEERILFRMLDLAGAVFYETTFEQD